MTSKDRYPKVHLRLYLLLSLAALVVSGCTGSDPSLDTKGYGVPEQLVSTVGPGSLNYKCTTHYPSGEGGSSWTICTCEGNRTSKDCQLMAAEKCRGGKIPDCGTKGCNCNPKVSVE